MRPPTAVPMPTTSPAGRARLLPVLLLALAAAGCDGTDEIVLDADFYVGTWTLVSVADDAGDRSAEALALLEALTVRFDADGSFRLDADFVPLVNAAGQPDVTTEGTFQARPEISALVLQVLVEGQTVAPSFQAAADTRSDVTLTAPAVIVEQLLGALQIDFSGNVVLGIRRQ